MINTISDSRPVVRVIYSYTCDLSGRFRSNPTCWPSGNTGNNEIFCWPRGRIGQRIEFPFVEPEEKPVNRLAWLEPCDSLCVGELREFLAPSTIVGKKALDIMDTNSGLWNTEEKEAMEDGKGLPRFSFSVDPFSPLIPTWFLLITSEAKSRGSWADHGVIRG